MKTIKKFMIAALALPCLGMGAGLFTSCSDVESSLVEYVEDYELDDPNDTVYSVIGIVGKLQTLADRFILLGELRSDNVVPTENATTDIYNLATFNAGTDNQYNKPSDYYAIIQNCNYYLAHVNDSLSKRGDKVFEREIAAVHAFRAWTYLQLAINYGKVPFVVDPILKEKDADPNLYDWYDVEQISRYFIDDLKPYIDTTRPLFGLDQSYFIRIRLLLADLNLWAGNYEEAAQLYFDFLNDRGRSNYISFSTSRGQWTDYRFQNVMLSHNSTSITSIRMESTEFDGLVSHLEDVFSSTANNSYYYQVTPSQALSQLSQSQHYVLTYTDPVSLMLDTVSPPDTLAYEISTYRGDLRLASHYDVSSNNTSNDTYNKIRQTISVNSFGGSSITIYTNSQVYLRYAEALNLAGYPESAFAVLKYGLCFDNNIKYLSEEERARAAHLIDFNQYNFPASSVIGIHGRGCGNVEADTTYIIPELPSRSDSIEYVEKLIVDEQALETMFEGMRFGDLVRYALRHNDTEWFANKVASRSGKLDEPLYARLLDRKNWYLPLPDAPLK